ncbi:MAG: elongation factor P--(R)-beta-lysine ligase [Methylobacteriaceae bacterium]|nr:elongation factor P--(R)-beta-lysine ligase [Methylobacteriaceae bacterium]
MRVYEPPHAGRQEGGAVLPEVTEASPWWAPHVREDRRPFLKIRSRVLAACRQFFGREHFVEVDVPALQVSPGNEAHISAFATELIASDASRSPLYLATSPEFTMKKLLAAGETRIFTLAHAYRNRERGALHHPEFTLLEWYRANEDYSRLIEDCAGLLSETAIAAGVDTLSYRGRTADAFAEPNVVTVADAFMQHAMIDLTATLDERGQGHRELLARGAEGHGIRVTRDDTWSDIFSKIMSEAIEPKLGLGRATILIDYPIAEAAWARTKADDPRFAERFELFACGVELANAFGELVDPVEQRRRFEAQIATRHRVYGESYPIDEDLLAALATMPPACGIALGFDRLVMLASGADRIEQVLWAPVPGASG